MEPEENLEPDDGKGEDGKELAASHEDPFAYVLRAIKAMWFAGLSEKVIADKLNHYEHKSPSGGLWDEVHVLRVVDQCRCTRAPAWDKV